jgi:transposase-like protein
VALEAVKQEKTISQLSSEYGVHANQINQWRKRVLEELPDIFSQKRKKKEKDTEELQSELYQQIGQLKVELDWLKKKSKLFV